VPDGQRYMLTIHAEGELRDKDGNLISNEPLTGSREVSEAEAQAIAEQLTAQQEIADDGRPLSSEPG
jgi:hypothetical protein